MIISSLILIFGAILIRKLLPKDEFYDYSAEFAVFGQPLIWLNIGGKKRLFIIDTGASTSVISDTLIDDTFIKFNQATLVGLDGIKSERNTYIAFFDIGDFSFMGEMVETDGENLSKICSNVKIDGLLGYDFMHDNGIKIDTLNHKLLI